MSIGFETKIVLGMNLNIKHRTLASAITEQLRQEILSNAHPAGTQLRQDALAATFGVSRIPVREALIQLEAEGLVQLIPHKGAVVTSLSRDEVNDVFDLRILLETRLFRDSIPKLTAEDFAQLQRIQASFSGAIRDMNLQQWGVLNTQVHTALYARAELPQTAAMVASLLQKSDRYTRVQLSSKNATKRAEDEHDALISLAKQGKADEACELLVKHIETVRRDLIDLLVSAPATPPAD